MLTDAFLSRLDALRMAMKDPAGGGAGGVRRSRSLGSSAEFSDFREYVPGDDIRRLDWNAYARFDKLLMKLFMEEKESVVTVLVDGSASMEEKREDAVKAAEAVSYLALGSGDRLRIAWMGEKETVLSPFWSGRRAYPQAADFLARQRMSGKTDLISAIRRIAPFPKGMSFLISDGYLEEGMEKTLDLLRYMRQECGMIQVLSPFEMNPGLEGALRLQDAEGAPEVEMLIDGAALRQYQSALNEFLKDVRQCCHQRGNAYMLLCGDEPFETAFLPRAARSGMIG